MAITDIINPKEAGAWTDRGVILAYAAIATICIAWMGRWVATTLLKALQANTRAMEGNTASNKTVIEYFETVSKDAIRNAINSSKEAK